MLLENLAQPAATEPPSVTQLLAHAQLDMDQNISFQIFDILRDLIVTVRLRPGQRLSEKEIAAALSASKTPVREALIRLDEIRLVRIVPQSGTYVTKISVNRYRTACFIRLQLELGAVRGAAEAPDPMHDISALDDLLDRQAQAMAQEDYDAFFDLDQAFHLQLFVMAGFADAWLTARRTQFDVNRARHIRRMAAHPARPGGAGGTPGHRRGDPRPRPGPRRGRPARPYRRHRPADQHAGARRKDDRLHRDAPTGLRPPRNDPTQARGGAG